MYAPCARRTPRTKAYGGFPAYSQILQLQRSIFRVTAAVHWTWSSKLPRSKPWAPFPWSFQHWAGVRPYTSSFNFAESCVFSKQSPPPCCATFDTLKSSKVLLFPKLRRKFAEFLQRSSLKRLSGTHSVTCGGLGYGACYIPCFLDEYRTPKRNPITLEVPWIVVAYIHTMAEKHRNTPRTMCFPIKCGFRLFLRDRLTLHRWTSVETLHYSAIMIFTWFSLLMSAFSLLISPIFLTKYLLRLQNVLLPNKELK